MFGNVLRQAGSNRIQSHRIRPRLELEQLEGRDCPSGTPVLSFGVSYGDGRTITLAGTVQGTESGYASVWFSGAASASTMTDEAGRFSVTVDADYLGAVQGTAVDYLTNMNSDVVEAMLTSEPPQVTSFTAVRLWDNVWSLQGTVRDESLESVYLFVDGLPSGVCVQTSVNADGSFSVTVELAEGVSGEATAQAMDCWALDSNVAETAYGI